MLYRNIDAVADHGRRCVAPPGAHRSAPHWAHVALVSLHTLCCGAPMALALLGIAAGVAGSGWVLLLHERIHAHEGLVLLGSLTLVGLGAAAEWRGFRKRGRVSALFLASAACLLINGAVFAAHHAA